MNTYPCGNGPHIILQVSNGLHIVFLKIIPYPTCDTNWFFNDRFRGSPPYFSNNETNILKAFVKVNLNKQRIMAYILMLLLSNKFLKSSLFPSMISFILTFVKFSMIRSLVYSESKEILLEFIFPQLSNVWKLVMIRTGWNIFLKTCSSIVFIQLLQNLIGKILINLTLFITRCLNEKGFNQRLDFFSIQIHSSDTSHSAYVATSTKSNGVKIDGLLPPNFL